MKLVPRVKNLINSDEIMTLKRGEFIFVPLEGKPVKVLVTPPWERESYQIAQRVTIRGTTYEPKPKPSPPQHDFHYPPNEDVPTGGTYRGGGDELPPTFHQASTPKDRVDLPSQSTLLPPTPGPALVKQAPAPVPMNVDLTGSEPKMLVHHSKADDARYYTTKNLPGKLLWVMVKDLPRDRASRNTDITRAMQEHGWNFTPGPVSMKLTDLAKEGTIISEGQGSWRLPRYLIVEVEEQ
jgi:hypothetical protein